VEIRYITKHDIKGAQLLHMDRRHWKVLVWTGTETGWQKLGLLWRTASGDKFVCSPSIFSSCLVLLLVWRYRICYLCS